MVFPILASLLVPVTLQGASPEEQTPPEPVELSDLPIEQGASVRCAVAFAVVGQWQKQEDPRGEAWPNMEDEGGREFFVRTMAQLMEQKQFDRSAISSMVGREAQRLGGDGAKDVEAMKEPCLSMKAAAGL